MSELDKSLSDLVNKTIGAVETVAPKVWESMVQATRIDAMTDMIVGVIWVLLLVAAGIWCRRAQVSITAKLRAEHSARNEICGYSEKTRPFDVFDSPLPLLACTGWVGAVFIIAVLVSDGVETVARFMNPEVYTAKALIEAAKQ